MPYYIRKGAPGCAGWATTHADGSVLTCHKTRGDAIRHMVAVSIATKEKPGGTWGTKKESIIDQMMIEAEMSAQMDSAVEEWDLLNERQKDHAKSLSDIAVEFGKFDQTSKANGAHYAPAKANPFKASGLMCKNCVFFDEMANGCQIVSGTIEPEAICKLWVIPESAITE